MLTTSLKLVMCRQDHFEACVGFRTRPWSFAELHKHQEIALRCRISLCVGWPDHVCDNVPAQSSNSLLPTHVMRTDG